jgi:hypothetical protein
MVFNGVEVLKMQFSRAIEQTFESFLDSWSLPIGEGGASRSGMGGEGLPTDVPVSTSPMMS